MPAPMGRRREPLNERKFLRPRGHSLTFQRNKALAAGPKNSEAYACSEHPQGRLSGFSFSCCSDARNMILPPHHHQRLPPREARLSPQLWLACSKSQHSPCYNWEVGCTNTSTQSLAPMEHIVYPSRGWDAFLKELCQHPGYREEGASVIPAKNIFCKE